LNILQEDFKLVTIINLIEEIKKKEVTENIKLSFSAVILKILDPILIAFIFYINSKKSISFEQFLESLTLEELIDINLFEILGEMYVECLHGLYYSKTKEKKETTTSQNQNDKKKTIL
jgi:hypothetical protein